VKPAAIRGVYPQQAERRSAYRIAIVSEDSVALEADIFRKSQFCFVLVSPLCVL
jgi:hypothetical protein